MEWTKRVLWGGGERVLDGDVCVKNGGEHVMRCCRESVRLGESVKVGY